MRGRPHRALAAAVALSLLAAWPAHAQDSNAPPGSKRSWLPKEAWVQDHWLPYDEGLLFSKLQMTREDIRVYFGGKKLQRVTPLADAARRLGYSATGLATQLVRAWHPRVSKRKYALLLDRATRSLTQGHLMQHMLFHPLHQRTLFHASMDIFGIPYEAMGDRLKAGQSRREVGHANGHSDAQMVSRIRASLKRNQDIGVRLHLTPRSEASKELAVQYAAIPEYLDQRGPAAADPQHMHQ